MNRWCSTSVILPPENEPVLTKISDEHGDRNEQRLKRKGRLWFVPDDSMCVYYQPTHWFKETGEPWRAFDLSSQGCRGYKSGEHYIWISWPWVDRPATSGEESEG